MGQWIIYSNGYIALCAVVMGNATACLFHVRLPESFLPFVFVGTLGSYSLHWYLTDSSQDDTERGRWNQRNKRVLLGLFVGAVLAGLWWLNDLKPYLGELLPVVLLTFLYTAPKINRRPFRILRQIAILKTAYLALVWTYVTAVLPLLMNPPALRPGGWMQLAWFVNRFLLIYSIAFWFDYRDRTDDRQSKWLTIVSMLTERQVRLFFGGIALCFGLTLVILYHEGLPAWSVFCLGFPMLLLLLTARWVVKQGADFGYYLYLDGLLMVSGLLLNLVPQGFRG